MSIPRVEYRLVRGPGCSRPKRYIKQRQALAASFFCFNMADRSTASGSSFFRTMAHEIARDTLGNQILHEAMDEYESDQELMDTYDGGNIWERIQHWMNHADNAMEVDEIEKEEPMEVDEPINVQQGGGM